jgi:hypothetical protein
MNATLEQVATAYDVLEAQTEAEGLKAKERAIEQALVDASAEEATELLGELFEIDEARKVMWSDDDLGESPFETRRQVGV